MELNYQGTDRADYRAATERVTQMNADAQASSFTKFRGKPFLITDRNGKTRFYDNGPRSLGYLVPDAGRERALREAIGRFNVFDRIFGIVMLVPAAKCIFSLYSDRAFAELSLTIAIVVIGRILARNWYFGDLVAGLDRLGPFDAAERRKGNLFLLLIAFAYFWFVTWRILKAVGIIEIP
jgi:hypothetical protein